MKRDSTPAMLLRNKIGTLTLMKAPEEEINKVRQELAILTLEPHLRAALELGVTPGKIAYLSKKLAGAK